MRKLASQNAQRPPNFIIIQILAGPSITGVSGVDLAHTFIVDPTGRYAVTESETQYQPIRIFDLKPGLDGTVKTISRPIGAWSPNWKNLVHQAEMRWPYVFAAGYADGLHVFNMMDPTNPT